MTRMIVAGQNVADQVAAYKATMVKRSWGDAYDSESLCAYQREMSRRGYIEAEIVKSNYGYSLRYWWHL